MSFIKTVLGSINLTRLQHHEKCYILSRLSQCDIWTKQKVHFLQTKDCRLFHIALTNNFRCTPLRDSDSNYKLYSSVCGKIRLATNSSKDTDKCMQHLKSFRRGYIVVCNNLHNHTGWHVNSSCAHFMPKFYSNRNQFESTHKSGLHRNLFLIRKLDCDRHSSDTSIWKKITIGVALLGMLGYYCYREKVHCAKAEENLTYVDNEPALQRKIQEAQDILIRIKDKYGCPGVAVSVSVDGKHVWSQGFGYANVEQRVLCTPNTVMRIASISKPLTMTMLARLWEDGKVDLDKPVSHYVKYWPEKTYKGEKVTITVRHLLSHMSGIRHYDKNCGKKKVTNDKKVGGSVEVSADTGSFEEKEYHIKRKFTDLKSSVNLFKDDELCFNPGSTFHYTTHGYTLLSAIIEEVSEEKFTVLSKRLFVELGLVDTYLDDPEPLIYNRAGQYCRDKKGELINSPYVDNSYKLAGGGFLSTAHDIVQFGNIMLYSYQSQRKNKTNTKDVTTELKSFDQGFLSDNTMKALWQPVSQKGWDKLSGWYGMGWEITPEISKQRNSARERRFFTAHTGGAVGGSSVLLIMPRYTENAESLNRHSDKSEENVNSDPPQGVVVTILVNMQSVSLKLAAKQIADIFI